MYLFGVYGLLVFCLLADCLVADYDVVWVFLSWSWFCLSYCRRFCVGVLALRVNSVGLLHVTWFLFVGWCLCCDLFCMAVFR